ncbi:MAG TPA: nucleotide exchange factor GrpE [Syntrophorhabdaceae bacterium]|nr:nucleotide exchange factor GrpE [Syntrophorhabdaceae bacterium]HOL05536.1 nucleotide exchange factor GrpE [Syntrophorhabdaceae bacterium]HON84902.1 nucleotide exchange factor GrpE [Syntrophorhabdaceae bacterium]HOT41458.1 nucleotide exchange factor GrpE [Syntrophorhabdaceae bacterium]HPC65987.1 nucleotide exchange factor GrpE [Syntrophorhabdaceae bacterium]
MEKKDEKDMEQKIEKEKEKEEGTSQEEHKKKKKKDELIEELNKQIRQQDETIKSLHERLLYLQADFENFKKIKNKEKQDLLKFGNEVLIKELLPVVDNLERALDHASKTDDIKGIQEGVGMVLNEFLKVLERAGVSRVEAVGKKFDPNLHEAFYQEERADVEPDTVLSEHQKGYILNGRLIRPSMVTVSKSPETHQ